MVAPSDLADEAADANDAGARGDRRRPRNCPRFCKGWLLVVYGMLNTFLWIELTPVYEATVCATDDAQLQRFTVGKRIEVGLTINVICRNPNRYSVAVMTSHPGRVWLGQNRQFPVGNLTLVSGSLLPGKGTGVISADSNTSLSPTESARLLGPLLTASELPIYVELHFDVGVGVTIMGHKVGIVAPFEKKCGMNLRGIFISSAQRLGPMVCKDSFEELKGSIPDVDSHVGDMSFSAAQMDPERVKMGEMAKNISIIGLGSLAYLIGLRMICRGWSGPTVEEERAMREARKGIYGWSSPTGGKVRRALNAALPSRWRSPDLDEEGLLDDPIADKKGGFLKCMKCISCGCMRTPPPPPKRTIEKPSIFRFAYKKTSPVEEPP